MKDKKNPEEIISEWQGFRSKRSLFGHVVRSERVRRALEMYFKHGTLTLGTFKGIYTLGQLRIRRIIYCCGGYERVMEETGLSYSAVSRWVGRESIPPKYWATLTKLLGHKIDLGDFAKLVLTNKQKP